MQQGHGVRRERQDQEWEEEELSEESHDEHHLLASEDFVSREDLVLGRVGQAINEQTIVSRVGLFGLFRSLDDEQGQSPQAVGASFLLFISEQHE